MRSLSINSKLGYKHADHDIQSLVSSLLDTLDNRIHSLIRELPNHQMSLTLVCVILSELLCDVDSEAKSLELGSVYCIPVCVNFTKLGIYFK